MPFYFAIDALELCSGRREIARERFLEARSRAEISAHRWWSWPVARIPTTDELVAALTRVPASRLHRINLP
jgi:hypothetical protein